MSLGLWYKGGARPSTPRTNRAPSGTQGASPPEACSDRLLAERGTMRAPGTAGVSAVPGGRRGRTWGPQWRSGILWGGLDSQPGTGETPAIPARTRRSAHWMPLHGAASRHTWEVRTRLGRCERLNASDKRGLFGRLQHTRTQRSRRSARWRRWNSRTQTPVQEQTIPLLARRARASSRRRFTGTGKTAAFGIPIVERVDVQKRQPQAVVLTPTRELAIQVTNKSEKKWAGLSGVTALPIYGGQPIGRQIQDSAARRARHRRHTWSAPGSHAP